MEYLSGNEYSADCAAWNGELFAIGIREKISSSSCDRVKNQSYQRLLFNQEIFNQIKEITKHFGFMDYLIFSLKTMTMAFRFC